MANEIDVYREWLGIKETARPLNYYQLFRLKLFEDSIAKIRDHYRQMNAHVRKFATGEYSARSQELLNEMAKAMLCLTDVVRKREYDASLGRKDSGEGKRRTFEEVLLAGKVVDRDQLEKARNFAEATGLEVRDAVLQQKIAPPEAVMLAYAESIGLPYVELDEVGVDAELALLVPPPVARQHSCVPVMSDEGQVLVASPNPLSPEVEDDLRLRFDMPVRTVLCTAASVGAAITKYYTGEAAAAAAAKVAKAAGKKVPAQKKPAAAKAPAASLTSEEQIKRRGMFALMGFNVAIVLFVLVRVFTATGAMLPGQFFGLAAIAVLIGLVVGGAVFAVMHFLDL